MELMSSNKSFYKYKISSEADLQQVTYDRRLRKAQQNSKTNFIFEITLSHHLEFNKITQFISLYKKQEDLVLASPIYLENLTKNTTQLSDYVIRIDTSDDYKFYESSEKLRQIKSFLFCPLTKPQLADFIKHFKILKKEPSSDKSLFWRFQPYNPNLNLSLTVKDIASNTDMIFETFHNIEIDNPNIPSHYELEPTANDSYTVHWQNKVPDSKPIISVIIPTYNNSFFLHNVILHLTLQTIDVKLFEVVIADDGSTDLSAELIKELFESLPKKINLTYLYWNKNNANRGPQFFFRSGLARNLGVRYSTGSYLQFLDSDMLVPANFLETTIESFKSYDVIQYQRFHVHQNHSRTNPSYSNINLKTDTYIEEEPYWSQLFFSENWTNLPDYWKYTCTYALALKREDFFKIGMFKKYYISYGFEDTDLGYEAFNRGLRFKLIKLPLLHLTSYGQMQYKNSKHKRLQLLRVTAELFYLQHLKKDIYNLLIDFYRFQKPVKSLIRDLLS